MMGQTKHAWVRAWLYVDPTEAERAYAAAPTGQGQRAVEGLVRNAARDAGLFDARAITQDPSDPTLFSAVARLGPVKDPDLAKSFIAATEPLEAPPAPPKLAHTRRNLDAGILEPELWCAARLLREERDPKRLEGAANQFAGDFPVISSLLFAKSHLEERMRARRSQSGASRSPDTRLALRLLGNASAGLVTPDLWQSYTPALEENTLPLVGHTASSSIVAPKDVNAYGLTIAAMAEDPTLVDEPWLIQGPADAVGAALKSVRRVAGLVLPDARLTRSVLPDGPSPVPNSAIKAAYGQIRPVVGRLAEPNTLAARLGTIYAGQPGSEEERARISLERAQRLLGRASWVDWAARWHHGYA